MRINRLIEQQIIPPGEPSPADELESVQDQRYEEISKIERAMEQAYFRAFQRAGVPLFSENGIPVTVTFYEENQTVEVMITTDDSFPLQALLTLAESGFVNAQTKIGPSTDRTVVIEVDLPAANTPFRQFLNLDPGTASPGGASSS